MHWAVVDLLDWSGIRNSVCFGNDDIDFFDIIVEKSCSDAIACGPDIEIIADSDTFKSCPPKSDHSSYSIDVVQNSNPASAAVTSVSPEIALAVYLGRVMRPGAVWIALSYSPRRFDHLKSSSPNSYPRELLPWTIERIHPLSVADIASENHEHDHATPVYRPEIFHYVYVLRRTNP